MADLDPELYTVAWIAPLEIEARAALHMLDNRHRGRFPIDRGDDYVFLAGDVCGHNVIIATLPAGQEYGTGSAAALAGQVKKFFRNLWFGLLVGVAAGLPNLSRSPPRDIRLGDVLVGLPMGESAGLIAYDLGKETENDGFQPLRSGYALANTETVVRSAIGNIKLMSPNDADVFLPYYENIKHKEHADGTFVDPGQEYDKLYQVDKDGIEYLQERKRRADHNRVRVWYGTIGSGEKLMKNARIRDQQRDKYDLIGLEMEAAGTMNRIAVGVIRGVCDYADQHKNKEWQPYAAAMAAAYAKAVLYEIGPKKVAPTKPVSAQTIEQLPAVERQGTERAIQLLQKFGFDREGNDMRGSARVGIHWAALNGHEEVLRLLLENNVNPERKSGDGETALHAAASKGHEMVVKILADCGANLEAKDNSNWTPLHRAARSGQTKMLELLLDLGADKDARGNEDFTILHSVAAEGTYAMAEILLRKGADVNATDSCCIKPLARLADKNYGYSPPYRKRDDWDEDLARLLIRNGADVNARDVWGITALHRTAGQGNHMMIKTLIDEGADVLVKDCGGKTPLDWAKDEETRTLLRLRMDSLANPKQKSNVTVSELDETWEALQY